MPKYVYKLIIEQHTDRPTGMHTGRSVNIAKTFWDIYTVDSTATAATSTALAV